MSVVLAAPRRPLTAPGIRLRLPNLGDVDALAAYASTPGGIDGIWVPVGFGWPRERLAALVEDWLRGWSGGESRDGPALLLDVPGSDRFVGYVGLGARGGGAVELAYGIAPDWRGMGLGTRATMLATDWLLAQPGVWTVELLIGDAHLASRRVAEKAGFTHTGHVRQTLAGTGVTYEDLRYVRSRVSDARRERGSTLAHPQSE